MHEPDLAALQPQETLEYLGDFLFPPYITLAHIFNAPDGWGFDGRMLKQHAVNYVLDGAGEVCVGGETFVAAKGDAFYYGPMEPHGLGKLPGQPFLTITIVFHFGDTGFPVEELIGARRYFPGCGSRVGQSFSELAARYRQPGTRHRFVCQSLLAGILVELSRGAAGRQQPAGAEGQRKNVARLVQVKNHIESRLDRELDAQELERIAGMSWNYLIAQFKRTFGTTPMQFLLWARVARAKELALQTPLSFGEIAARVGYRDVHAFSKMFRNKTGMSLTAFCASVYELDHRIYWPGNEALLPEQGTSSRYGRTIPPGRSKYR